MTNVIDMQQAAKLIQEAREARELRRSERKSAADMLIAYLEPHRQVDGTILIPGGIDDMEA